MKKQANSKKPSTLIPAILIGIGALLVFAVLAIQLLQSPGTAQSPAASPPSQQAQNIPEPGIQRVSLADAKTAFDQKTALFLDVRDEGSYAAGHIPGAVNIPEALLESRLGELDPNAWIITYCT